MLAPLHPSAPSGLALRRGGRVLLTLMAVGLLVVVGRAVGRLLDVWSGPAFLLGLLLANVALYLLVTRRGGLVPAAGQTASTLLVAGAVLLHLSSVGVALLVGLLIALGA